MTWPARVVFAASCMWLGAACATPASTPKLPAPEYTRSWSPYTPELLNRDVVECAEQARADVSGRSWVLDATRPELRVAIHTRTTACMEQRGWTRVSAR